MKILQFGATGQLAREMIARADARGVDLAALSRADADLTDPDAVTRAIAASDADIVVNAAAYTAVDQAETDEDAARAINADAPGAMARACAARGVPLIHVSTDYVFAGDKAGAYVEDEPVSPLGAYGRTKEAGEAAIRAALPRHVILRTAWVYSPFGRNFVKTMLRVGAERSELRVVDDQHGCPTAAGDIAETILTIAEAVTGGREDAWGTYHYAGAGETSWHGFAETIFALSDIDPAPHVAAIPSSEFPTPAERPKNSVLDTAKIRRTFGVTPRPWREALAETLDRLRAGEG